MVVRWNRFSFHLKRVFCITLVFHSLINECSSINLEGLALLEFRERVETDPYGALANWSFDDVNPCSWSGVHCVEDHVHKLDLRELSLCGMLAPEIGRLSHLRALVLNNNHFSGEIPKEIAELSMLELLDLRGNDLNGTIPAEIGHMPSLKFLLLGENKFEGSVLSDMEKIKMLPGLQHDQNLLSDVATNRKVRHCIWQRSLKQFKKANCLIVPLKEKLGDLVNMLPRFKFCKGSLHGEKCYGIVTGSPESYIEQNVESAPHFTRRRLLDEFSVNLAALPATGASIEPITSIPSLGSGSFPAITSQSKSVKQKPPEPSPNITPSNDSTSPAQSSSLSTPNSHTTDITNRSPKGSDNKKYIYMVPAGAFFLAIASVMLCMCRSKGVATIGPWKSGLSGQLQKAFVTGVPKLKRAELETACEDFSNIVSTLPDCRIFKGNLSNGTEIAVASTSITSVKDWSKRSEQLFRKKVDVLSRVNHKNFVNLLGYCDEDEPFLRMMVFEYAPSGTLFEHLHVNEVEHLDWPVRMRIIMGIAYCLRYMHHDLNPPVVHSNLKSDCIYLTDDYAAKITEIGFWRDFVARGKISGNDDTDLSELPSGDTESNVYNFGILLLEIISGKLPNSDEQGSLVNLATEYVNDKRSISYMIDPTLKSFENNELDIISEVIQECIHHDPLERPTMKEATAKLREVITISPDAATPRSSPLWWAELEILSVEAS